MVRTRCGKGEDGKEGHQIPTFGVQTRSMKWKLDEDAAQQGSSSIVRVDDLKEFQRILKERKAESKRLAELKRVEGLRRIRERKAKTGVQPLEHFPKEVWCLVLDELLPSDKANIWQVHPLFPGLMQKNRIRDILFPLILDHKLGFIQKYFVNRGPTSISVSPVILQLRLLSKSMRNAVDKWFEDNLLTLICPRTKIPGINVSFWDTDKSPLQFQMTFDEDKLQKILEIKKSTKTFKRDLYVVGSTSPPSNMGKNQRLRFFNIFVANVTEALRQLGDQIWRFRFYCKIMHTFGVTLPQVYSILKEWFHHLPNVKLIDICFGASFRLEPFQKSSLGSDAFPTLHDLKRFDLRSCHQGVEFIVDAIISSNPQIKMVNINGNSEYHLMSRPSVKALNLELCQLRTNVCPVLFKKIETTAGTFNWTLKMLELNFDGMGSGASINSLIQLLNIFPTLESLFLDKYSVTFSDEEIDFLRLPNLTRFGISFVNVDGRKYDRKTHFFFTLQFMLHSKKLESLRWSDDSFTKSSGLSRSLYRQILSYELEHSEEMLDFGGGFNDLADSNLWDTFPNLNLIEVKIRGMQINKTFRKSKSRGCLSSLV